MTQLVVFNDEHNEEESLLSCHVPSFDPDTGPVSQLEEALQKISAPSTFPDLPLSDNHFTWETDSRFSTSLTDFLLSDQVTKFELETSDLASNDTSLTTPCEDDAQLSKMNDYSASSAAPPCRQMDLSPRSVVDISNPSFTARRSPYCIIRSSHSATAAAAAATAAMIVNDHAMLSVSKSSSSMFDLQQSPLTNRPRIHEESDSEILSTTSMKSSDGGSQDQATTTIKPELMPMIIPGDRRSGALKPKGEKFAKRGTSDFKAIKIGKPGTVIKKETAVKAVTGFTKALTKKELSAIERARQCRAEALVRFRKKKSIRSFGRRVRYECRKRIATTRPRVNGRFAKKSDLEAIQKS